MRKKVDNRIRTLIENGIALHHRGMFVIVGDKGRDQVVNLHYMLSKSRPKQRPNVLWCYKKDLGFSSHKRKRMRQVKRDVQRGLRQEDTHDPFELFLTSTEVRYCYYHDSHKILGKTFGMCVLQDFEALTPNLLARTIETVEGGGLVILLLKTMSSLKSLFAMSMDVHNRFRTESHQDVVGRFNERFILSLAHCRECLVVDDELNILPISSHARSLTPVAGGSTPIDDELTSLQVSLADTPPISHLVNMCRTSDQAKALMQLVNCIQEADTRSIISLTAARGRGKSACLGLAIASAVAYGLSNIFVCAPSVENLSTLFQLVFKGFDALDYAEHVDYEIIKSKTTGDVIKVNVHRDNRRQTVQFVQAKDAHKLLNCELLVIDEAAAIPLPLVKDLLGNFLTVLSSTINGYEGTGRSLSLKLFTGLRKTKSEAPFVEIKLERPIRYGHGDCVEKWLNDLLCLDCSTPPVTRGAPHPSTCELYYVNRDTLFSHHKASEAFLQRLMSLFVSSHYKNSPNDLQLMSDAPAHHLFVLLGPQSGDSAEIPDILAVIQVALEGEISKRHVRDQLARAMQPTGDLIPWTVSQQFQDDQFPGLSGARIVRIATHPSLQRMGYGSRALSLLRMYYSGEMSSIAPEAAGGPAVPLEPAQPAADAGKGLLEEVIAPRAGLPPILDRLPDRPAEQLDYLGTSFGMTQSLYNFWAKLGYVPIYLRQTTNEITGENTVILVNRLDRDGNDWLVAFSDDFRNRFIALLPQAFRSIPVKLALSIVNPSGSLVTGNPNPNANVIDVVQLKRAFSQFDLRRLEAYSKSLVDYHLILDLIPCIARMLFQDQMGPTVRLSFTQAALALGIGLQFKSVSEMQAELEIESNQILALLNKLIRKVVAFFNSLLEGEARAAIQSEMASAPPRAPLPSGPVRQSLSKDLAEGARETHVMLYAKQQALLESTNLAEYAIKSTDDQWSEALPSNAAAPPSTISVKSSADKKRKMDHSAKPAKTKKNKMGNKKASRKRRISPESGAADHFPNTMPGLCTVPTIIVAYLAIGIWVSRRARQQQDAMLVGKDLPVVYLDDDDSRSMRDLCTICMEDFDATQPLNRLPCGHLFHRSCTADWNPTIQSLCPNCREPVRPSAVPAELNATAV
ncbi:RNA cytidine acetyltransferase [Plasmodiophora brassicae]